jgi:hypothetical protein
VSIWSWAGLVCNVMGVVLAAWGIRLTWGEHSDEPFWRPASEAGRRLRRCVRRLFGRPVTQTLAVDAAVLSLSGAEARLEVKWGPLPDDPAEQVTEIERRLHNVHRAVQDLQHNLVTERGDRESADEHLRGDMDRRLRAVESVAHSVAVSGLRLEAVGLGLVAVGTVLQAVGG